MWPQMFLVYQIKIVGQFNSSKELFVFGEHNPRNLVLCAAMSCKISSVTNVDRPQLNAGNYI